MKDPELTVGEFIGRMLGYSFILAISYQIGHELGHSNSFIDQMMSRFSFMIPLDIHFT